MDEARLALIIAAILALAPEDFNKDKSPKLAAIKAAVPDITAEELKTVLAKIKEDTPPPETEVTVSFDTAGANHVVTLRDGKAVKVWFRDGKEIGVENAG